MHSFSKALTAVALAATTATSVTVPADAATRRHHYSSRTRYYHKVCRYSSGAPGLALLSGFRVDFARTRDVVERLIEVGIPPPPPVVRIEPVKPRPEQAAKPPESAPRAAPAPPGGSPGPVPAHAPPSVTPVV